MLRRAHVRTLRRLADEPRRPQWNIVNRHSTTGVADGVCSVSGSSAECFPDSGGAPTTHDGWPLSDGYYNVTQEAEAGTRTIWGSLNRGGLGCWDWATMTVCAGAPFVDGWVDRDTAGNGLPSAYGATFDGASAIALGDPGLLFTMAPSGQSPCTSLGTGAQTTQSTSACNAAATRLAMPYRTMSDFRASTSKPERS